MLHNIIWYRDSQNVLKGRKLEYSPLGGYGAANAREMEEMEAMEEYITRIGDCKFHGINEKTMKAIGIDKFQQTDDTISFRLEFIGDNEVMPGEWHRLIGTVKVENCNITVEV